MDNNLKCPTTSDHHASSSIVCVGPNSSYKKDIADNMEQNTAINPIAESVVGKNTAQLNSNLLYDALPTDNVLASLMLSHDVHNDNSDMENNQLSQTLAPVKDKEKPIKTPLQDSSTVSQNQSLVDYEDSDMEDSASESVASITDSESNSAEMKSKPTPPVNVNVPRNNTEFRERVSSSESASEYESDSSTSFSEIGACGVTVTSPINKKALPETMKVPRTKGELTLDQLPPIEEMKISVPEDQCIEIGVVTSIIDQLVIVQSNRGTPACDIDTLFFLNRGSFPLGRVFDVLGPVSDPLYAVRFNSYQQAMETGVKPGTPVYCAPRTQHTAYVFVSELMKMKGSDASWEHNNEPPEACLDYSDDEEERQARRAHRSKRPATTEVNKSNSLERNKRFEKQMNDKNILMNERYKNQQAFTARNTKKKPDIRPPMMSAAVGPPQPHPWVLHNPAAALPRPFWSAPPYQFAAYPPYGPLAMFPQLDVTGARQHFVPPMLAAAPPPPTVFAPPFNPNIPPPMMRPQPVPYFQKPRHPPWVPPTMNLGVSVLQPPRGNFGNGSSYTQ